MRKVLIYIEPHPIRNYYEEFYDVGLLLCQAMLQLGPRSGYVFRYVSNDAIIDRVISEAPTLSYLSLRFTAAENKYIESLYGQWNIRTISEWLSLVKGQGPVCDFYVSALKRIHEEFPFDAILLWSDNGAVRQFCLENDIAILHAEYGPTRKPFHQTIYLDPNGTNGASAVLQAPLHKLNPKVIVPRETWITRHGKLWNDERKVGLIDIPTTLQEELFVNKKSALPYLFIPLQLEDDLNTQLYSEFRTPEEFLRHVIPQALKLGLAVVVKGHPGAVGRTFNLIAQNKAINYAETMGDQVTVMPYTATAFETIHVMAQAAAVATINSSVGFEALLLGKTTLLFGVAAFDIGGELNIYNQAFDAHIITQPNHEHLDKLTSFLCCHYLHPIESVTEGDALATVLDYIFETKNKPKNTQEFWQGWIDRIDHGYRWLSQTPATALLSTGRDSGPLAGNRFIFEGTARRVDVDSSVIQVTATSGDERIFASARNEVNSFFGVVDSVKEVTEKDDTHLQVSGWALDLALRPPIQIFFCYRDTVISLHRVLTKRRDVAEALKASVALRCGFTFNVDKKFSKNIKNCRLIFLSSNNSAHIINLSEGFVHRV